MSEMDQLDRIFAEGTYGPMMSKQGKPSNRIVCADGFEVSVVAGYGTYCIPRPDFGDRSYEGPYEAVEVGYPSQTPEPWAQWSKYAEASEPPTDTVYARVPIKLVRALVDSHGGVA